MKNMNVIILLIFFCVPQIGLAKEIGSVTGWEIPRYVSIKSDDANLRVGPSKNYPILIKYIKSNFPIKIIEEYKEWRKVEDFKKNTGWIHESLLIGQRSGLIISPNLNNIPVLKTKFGVQIGEISDKTIVELIKCEIDWCLIKKDNYKGWVKKNYIWGAFKNEEFNLSYFQSLYNIYYTTLNYLENNWLGR